MFVFRNSGMDLFGAIRPLKLPNNFPDHELVADGKISYHLWETCWHSYEHNIGSDKSYFTLYLGRPIRPACSR